MAAKLSLGAGGQPVSNGNEQREVAEGLKQALRRLAKAVAIVTASEGELRLAMCATAVCEVSLDPPSMLVCVNRSASLYPLLARGVSFAINILDVSQANIATCCGGAVKGEARFQVGSWYGSEKGVPLLAGAQACIMCDLDRKIDYGTHGIFIGKVLGVVLSGQPDPLVYVDGRYTRVKLDSPDA